MSIDELVKIVRRSNLFDSERLMDAIESINDETRSKLKITDDGNAVLTTANDLLIKRNKNYRGRLSKILIFHF